jgi:carbohydrate-selective porin OprB
MSQLSLWSATILCCLMLAVALPAQDAAADAASDADGQSQTVPAYASPPPAPAQPALQPLTVGFAATLVMQIAQSGGTDADTSADTDADTSAATLSGDLWLESPVGDHGTAYAAFEFGRGVGTDAALASLHGLNADAIGASELDVLELWYGQRFARGWYLQVGHVDLTDSFDANAVANDETAQFLSGGFVNALTLPTGLANSLGAELWVDIGAAGRVGLGTIGLDRSGSASYDQLFHHAIVIAQAEWAVDGNGLGGIWRLYAWHDSAGRPAWDGSGASPTSGGGCSIDQAVHDRLRLFLRIGVGDERAQVVATHVSVGGGLTGALAGRPDDTLALAVGRAEASDSWRRHHPDGLRATDLDAEWAVEWYYRASLNHRLDVSVHCTHLIDPAARADGDPISAAALRAHLSF